MSLEITIDSGNVVDSREVAVCRACLATEGKLARMCASLADSFQELLGTSVCETDGLPQHICSCCRYLLHKYAAFRRRCHAAQFMLLNARAHEVLITSKFARSVDRKPLQLSQKRTRITHVDIPPEPPLKPHIEPKTELAIRPQISDNIVLYRSESTPVKRESEYDPLINKHTEEKELDVDNVDRLINSPIADDSDTDSEINLPIIQCTRNDTAVIKRGSKINMVKKVIGKRRVEDNENKVKSSKRSSRRNEKLSEHDDDSRSNGKIRWDRFPSDARSDMLAKKYDVDVVMLSKEEQMKTLEARKESDNYLNSPYKCEHCFKGYMDEVAFQNHMLVHDAVRGSHICEICRYRFRTRRKLVSHAARHRSELRCRKCSFVSKDPSQARAHHQWHEGVTLACEHCGKQFEKPTSRLSHIRIFHGTVRCPRCGERFINDRGLNAHLTKAHQLDLTWCCATCDVHFQSASALAAHSAAGCDTTTSVCAVCGASFPSGELLAEHAREHSFQCDQCPKTFPEAVSLRRHRKLHNRRRLGRSGAAYASAVICEVCGLRCINMCVLRAHQLVHTGELPHACPHCPKRFRILTSLQSHMSMHTGVRRYQCALCPKAFATAAGRNRHKVVHTGERRFACALCDKAYQTSSCLKMHVRTAHMKEPWPKRTRTKRTIHQ